MISHEDMLMRLAVAAMCGMLLGLEREMKNRPAGLRTFMLVTLGSAGFALIVMQITGLFAPESEIIKLDPTRVAEGIIGGIGFLGAGTILQSRGEITGITTGATIWLSGAIGLACGVGMFFIAFTLTGFSLFILLVLGALERYCSPEKRRS